MNNPTPQPVLPEDVQKRFDQQVDGEYPHYSEFLTFLAQELTRLEAEKQRVVYQCMCCGFRSDGVLMIHNCDWTRSLKVSPLLEALHPEQKQGEVEHEK